MKVLLMSDSHGLTSEIEEIINRHKDEVSEVLHCGDSELGADSPQLSLVKGVKGNCDFGSHLPNELTQKINDKILYVTHGHLYNVKATLMNLKYRAMELQADVVCYGHSHIAGAEMIDGVLFINPGSIRLPKLRKEKTYAILEMDKNILNIQFLDIYGEIIEGLSRQFKLK